MPPFGNLYGMKVYVAEELAEDEEIAFNAGSHTELIRMPYESFRRLVKPVEAAITA
jgi:Ala-tRNA(Pro) deacylase